MLNIYSYLQKCLLKMFKYSENYWLIYRFFLDYVD